MNFVNPIPEENWDSIGWTNMMSDKPQQAELVWMSPDKFLQNVYPYDSEIDFQPDPLGLARLKEAVSSNLDFAPLQLWDGIFHYVNDFGRDVSIRSHEGRHRAWLARELGIESIPVLLWRRYLQQRYEASPGHERRAGKARMAEVWARQFAEHGVQQNPPLELTFDWGGDVVGADQYDGWIAAYVPNRSKPVGILGWSVWQNEYQIHYVTVDPEYRRQGVATALYKKLLEQQDLTIDQLGTFGDVLTPEGAALRRSLHGRST